MSWPQYRHVISLGSFCGTAWELRRYGLRDGSYPFDWLICEFEPMLMLLESGFDGLFEPEHLKRDPEHPWVVHDMWTGVTSHHDFVSGGTILEQVDAVRQKYQRRIARFNQAAAEPTLFIRHIADEQEHARLDSNMDTFLALLRRGNPRNELILVGNPTVPAKCGGRHVYRVDTDADNPSAGGFGRTDGRIRLKLLLLFYPPDIRIRNLIRYWSPRTRATMRRALRRALGPVLILLLGKKRYNTLITRVRDSVIKS